VGFEVPRHTTDRVRFAEHAGESLPRGEDFDRRLCCGGLAGHTASVWRRSCQLRAAERREEVQRTAAAMEAIGGLVGVVVGLRLRDLQLWLVQVVHFVLKSGCEWVVG
jgi:non-ribosomal peptide synthetase component F